MTKTINVKRIFAIVCMLMALLFSFLNYMGIEKERTRVEWVSAAEGARFSAVMNEFVKTVTDLGENKRLTDLRVKEGK